MSGTRPSLHHGVCTCPHWQAKGWIVEDCSDLMSVFSHRPCLSQRGLTADITTQRDPSRHGTIL